MNGFARALQNLAANTEPNRRQGDYIQNGLLHCGKCKTPKQCVVSIGGELMKPYCMCECEAAAARESQQRAENTMKKEEIERNRSAGFLDSDMIGCTFGKDDKKNPRISEIAQRYVTHFDKMLEKGKGLIFFGNAGTGKSYMAACIANALIDKGYKCLMTNFPRIINELTGLREGKQRYIDNLNTYQLIVIDDLAVERDTEYTAEIVQNVIDSRYRAGKPLIITTNLTKAEYERPSTVQKQRLYSRLYEMCLPLALVGEDRRKTNAAAKDSEMKALLGI